LLVCLFVCCFHRPHQADRKFFGAYDYNWTLPPSACCMGPELVGTNGTEYDGCVCPQRLKSQSEWGCSSGQGQCMSLDGACIRVSSATPRTPVSILVTPRAPIMILVTPRAPVSILVTSRAPISILVTRAPVTIVVTSRAPVSHCDVSVVVCHHHLAVCPQCPYVESTGTVHSAKLAFRNINPNSALLVFET
jgi:hypothetical protein